MHGRFFIEWEDEHDRDRYDLIQLPWHEFEKRYIDANLMNVTGIPRYFAVHPEDSSLIFWPFPVEPRHKTSIRDNYR